MDFLLLQHKDNTYPVSAASIYDINDRNIVKDFVMRFALAVNSKHMSEEKPSRTRFVIFHGFDDMS